VQRANTAKGKAFTGTEKGLAAVASAAAYRTQFSDSIKNEVKLWKTE
jgi:hypothetical protein